MTFTDKDGKISLEGPPEDVKNAETILNNLASELDLPFSRPELIKCIKTLKNNKSSSFDSVIFEMIKCGRDVLYDPLRVFFSSILGAEIFPSEWKRDILQPLHKSGPLDDPNKYRGISIAAALGKVFNTLLRNRLEMFVKQL